MALVQTLNDPLRLGRVYTGMCTTFWVMGEVDRAIDYGQRALALAIMLGHGGLQARAYGSLGQAYYDAGDYPRAMESLERNVVTLQGDLHYERSGATGSVPVTSRAWLSYCHTERGAFTEALAMAEDGLRIAETVQNPFSQIEVPLKDVRLYKNTAQQVESTTPISRLVYDLLRSDVSQFTRSSVTSVSGYNPSS